MIVHDGIRYDQSQKCDSEIRQPSSTILVHSQLGMIPVSKERQVMTIQGQIDDILRGIEELKKKDGSHLSGGGIAHAIEEFVEHIYLLLTQRLFKRYAELVEIVRKLGGVKITLAVVVNHINHRYISFQIQYYRKKTALKSSLIGVY